MPITKPEDVKNLYIGSGVLPTDQKITALIEVLEEQVLAEYPGLPGRIADGRITERKVRNTIAGWLIEYIQTKGSPYQSESQSVQGVGSRSVSMASKARVSLTLTPADLEAFAPYSAPGFSHSMTQNAEKSWMDDWTDLNIVDRDGWGPHV